MVKSYALRVVTEFYIQAEVASDEELRLDGIKCGLHGDLTAWKEKPHWRVTFPDNIWQNKEDSFMVHVTKNTLEVVQRGEPGEIDQLRARVKELEEDLEEAKCQ